MYNIFEDLEQTGIEKGKKMSIYEAFINGAKMEELTRFFKLSISEITKIIEEMKQRKPLNGSN